MKERARDFRTHLKRLSQADQDELMITLNNMGQLNDREIVLDDGSVIQTSPERAAEIKARNEGN